MRVFVDHQVFSRQKYGGISRYFTELFRQFFQRPELGCEILFPLKYNANSYLRELPQFSGLHQFSTDSPLVTHACTWLNQRLTEKVYRQADFDLMHPTFYHSYLLSHRKRPMICTIHDLTPERFPDEFSGTWFKNTFSQPWIRAKRALAHESEGLIAVSGNTKRDMVELYGISADRITVIHLGYTPLTEQEPARSTDRQPPYILYVGLRDSYKNFKLLLNAYATWHLQYPDCQLLCVGGGSFTVEEQSFITEHGLESKVSQRNATDAELASAYCNAVFFVYPSNYEGFGLPILEAFANSCPALLSDSSCFPEIGGEAARYFEADSQESLMAEMTRLYENQELRQQLITRGHERVKAFTWAKTAEKTAAVYRQVLG